MMHRIELAGKQYALRFTVNSVCCLEESRKTGLDALLQTSISCIRALLRCGLMEQEKMTEKEAGELLQKHLEQGGSLMEVGERLADALAAAGFFQVPGPEEKRKACESSMNA